QNASAGAVAPDAARDDAGEPHPEPEHAAAPQPPAFAWQSADEPQQQAPAESEQARTYAEEPGAASESDAAQEARAVLENGVRTIAGEVRNSLDFQRSQEGGADVSRVVLSGSALELEGFAQALQAALGVEVVPGTVDVADGSQLRGLSPDRLAVAAGLATAEITR